MAKAATSWIMSNKGPIGLLFGLAWVVSEFVVADQACVVSAAAIPAYCAWAAKASAVLGKVGLFLVGAGYLPSDWNHKQSRG